MNVSLLRYNVLAVSKTLRRFTTPATDAYVIKPKRNFIEMLDNFNQQFLVVILQEILDVLYKMWTLTFI